MRSVMLRSLRMPATADNSRPPAHTQGGRRACEAPGQPLPSAPEEGAGMVTTFQPTTASAAVEGLPQVFDPAAAAGDRKSTRLNSSHLVISYAVFCLKKKKKKITVKRHSS